MHRWRATLALLCFVPLNAALAASAAPVPLAGAELARMQEIGRAHV